MRQSASSQGNMIKYEFIDRHTSPPGGWKITASTGITFKHYDYRSVRNDYKRHCLANGIMLSPTWEEEFLSTMCEQNPHWGKQCVPAQKSPQRRRLTLEAALSFLNMMRKWAIDAMGGKPAFVSQEEAERRASICASCPNNGNLQFGCGACMSTVLQLLHAIIGKRKTSRDSELGACLVCSCSLKVSVHVPTEVQHTGLPDHLKDEFKQIDWCWKREGL